MTYWEYKVVPIVMNNVDADKRPGAVEEILNDLGNDGWEFVGLSGPASDNMPIFKRQMEGKKPNLAKSTGFENWVKPADRTQGVPRNTDRDQ